MKIKDYSPKHENKDNIELTLYKFNNKEEFIHLYEELTRQGYKAFCSKDANDLWNFRERYCKRFRFIETDFNSITGKKDMAICSLATLATYPQYSMSYLRKRIKTLS